jgi:hypothetical protein
MMSPDEHCADDPVAALLKQTLAAARLSRQRIANELEARGEDALARLYRSTIA